MFYSFVFLQKPEVEIRMKVRRCFKTRKFDTETRLSEGRANCISSFSVTTQVRAAVPSGFNFQFHYIATRNEWKVVCDLFFVLTKDPGSKHPFRMIASALPCMIRYENGVAVKTLLEDDCWDEANLKSIFE
jgi:hypothetical protein